MITKTMTLAEALRVDRTIAPIFMSYGMHCLGCPHATAESIEQACAVHGVDVDELIEKLNAHLDSRK